MSYDPEARRDTPLAKALAKRIRRKGPISVKDYMTACLLDPEHGYYRTRTAIGAAGDFITAPEISQIFGELIGLWCAVVWQQMGSPQRVNIVELGPGRGTMMHDAMRAGAKVPGFIEAAGVLLIEPNATLRQVQSRTLTALSVPISHLDPPQTPAGPSIFLANEVLDCIPVWQLQWVAPPGSGGRWHTRTVELDRSGRLAFGIGPEARMRPQGQPGLLSPQPGDILEDRNARGVIGGIGKTADTGPVAVLLIDYGHLATTYGDTLQAVRDHAFEHPLTSPGEADLTAQVDFAALSALVGEWNSGPGHEPLAIDGPVSQATFLARLGIVERTSRLMAANPALAHRIEADAARLVSPSGMGSRFKAIGLRSPSLPPLPGFPGKA
jgi:NADH dehydrogenase [ubiquinone] 1 alpha subcomplex assembly factor 7